MRHTSQIGARHGVLLIAVSWLAVIAAGVLAPVLPKMASHFAGARDVGLMIGFVATMPALAVALLSIPAGRLVDRVGARPVLLVGLAGFGVLGLLPMLLDSLSLIVVARFLVGICEAGVMTASTSLLSSCFEGRSRERWLTAQVASVNLMGMVVVFVGGLAGQSGWRTPFLAYGFALLLLVPVAVTIRPPRPAAVLAVPGQARHARWPGLASGCLATTLVSVAVYIVVIQFSFLLAERGVVSPAAIGTAIAIAASGMVAGAVGTAALLRIRPTARLAAALFLIAAGTAIAAAGTAAPAMIAGMWITGLGAGIGVPTLLAMVVGRAAAGARGAVTGAWTSALFLGQFLNPPAFVVLRRLAGGEAGGIALASWIYAIVAFAIAVTLVRPRRRRTS